VTVTHALDEVAVQLQPASAVTETVPLVEVAGTDAPVADSVYVHPTPACVMAND
jgi:hypothetical protein